MIYKVMKKQYNADDCFVCGIKNSSSLGMHFYELKGNILLGVAQAKSIHQGYPSRMHGGIITALLDEAIGRAINIYEKDTWGVTVKIKMTFKKPVPLNEPIYALAIISENRNRMFEGFGVLLGADKKTVLAEANAKYMKQDIKNIADHIHLEGFNLIPDDLKEFEFFYEFIRS